MAKRDLTLGELTGQLLTMREAAEWIEKHLEDYGLARPPKPDTLKTACHKGRLKGEMKGHVWFTRTQELKEYLRAYDPKNKSESKPLKPRALNRRNGIYIPSSIMANADNDNKHE